MKLFEYQAKEIFNKYQIKTPDRILVNDIKDLVENATKLGFPCVVKAQVLHGGRGKANLVKIVSGLDELEAEGKRIFETTGQPILLEACVEFTNELYLSIALDPFSGNYLLMACSEGGVDIEHLAINMPEKIRKYKLNPFIGFMPYEANDIAIDLGITEKEIAKKLTSTLMQMYQVFTKEEASLVEINPLVISSTGDVIALDAKVDIDDSAMFRHKIYPKTRAYFDKDIEYLAAQEGIPYIEFEGDIGMMVAGAGLANVVFDLINDYGGSIANYLEFGGPNYTKGYQCLEMMLSRNPKCILIVTFGTIARADVMAEGIVEAVKKLNPIIPIICSIKGTGEDKADELLASVGIESIKDTEKAVAKAVELVKELNS